MKTDPQTSAPQSGGEAVAARLFDPGSSARISVQEIARRLQIGRLAVYAMLERAILPGVRVGRRWIITRQAYERWERTCGAQAGAGLHAGPEVKVLN